MGRLAALLGLAACGCYASHTVDTDVPADAAARDAAPLVDATLPDAPVVDVDAAGDVASIVLTITVGDDSLADLAWPLRTDHSSAFGYVRLRGSDTPVEIDLNEHEEWAAGTTHTRAIPLPAGTPLTAVHAVGIRHEAAGPPVATDNWTMNAITVTTDRGVVLLTAAGTPLWTFQRDSGQRWEHELTP